jgi:flagellar M-ring protein FliF
VNVSAALNADLTDQTEERFDPASVVRSRTTSTETGASVTGAGGVAGARANQPPGLSTSTANSDPAAATPAATGAAASAATGAGTIARPNVTAPGRSTETTNYEVSRTTTHTVTGLGQVSRLSLAVIIDDHPVAAKAADGAAPAAAGATAKSWDPEEIKRLHGLVSAAVGLDPKRGDQLTIENIAFETPSAEPEPPAPGIGSQVMTGVKQYWPSALRSLGILGIALFALFGILRPMSRRATAVAATALPAPAAAAARLPTISEMEGQIDEEVQGQGPRRLPVLTKRVAKLANEEPEQLARIVRGWMAEDHR